MFDNIIKENKSYTHFRIMTPTAIIFACACVISAPLIHSFLMYSLFLCCSFWIPLFEGLFIENTNKKSQ